MATQIFGHNLSQDDLATQLKAVVAAIKFDYKELVNDFTEEWLGAFGTVNFSIMGSKIWVTLEPGETELTVETNDPFGQVMPTIAPKIEVALQKRS
ncbi:hypothetical protein HYT05_02800 [Candidatus Kaiserbacteria bacterium]|nr:hypothetical protein [Candidatus Kaiserbacteria bacterium]